MDPDLNNSLGNVAMDKDRYTEKCVIIKVSLTEVIFTRRKDLSAATDQTTLKEMVPSWEPSPDSGPGAGRLWTYARVDRTKTGDTQFSFPAEKLVSTFACVCQPNCFCRFSANFVCIYHRSQWLL